MIYTQSFKFGGRLYRYRKRPWGRAWILQKFHFHPTDWRNWYDATLAEVMDFQVTRADDVEIVR